MYGENLKLNIDLLLKAFFLSLVFTWTFQLVYFMTHCTWGIQVQFKTFTFCFHVGFKKAFLKILTSEMTIYIFRFFHEIEVHSLIMRPKYFLSACEMAFVWFGGFVKTVAFSNKCCAF